MTNTFYLEKLKDPRWQKKRLVVLDRDGWRCQLCGDVKTTLHVHHKKYSSYNPWEAVDEDLITYCEHCHEIVGYYDQVEGAVVLKIMKYPHIKIESNFLFLVRVDGPNNPAISIFELINGDYNFHTHLFKDQWEGINELVKIALNG